MQVLLFNFRQCEDYSEQSEPYFEPLTFARQRCLLQREYFDFVCLLIFIEYLYCVWRVFGYVFILILSLIRRSEFFTDDEFRDKVKCFCSTVG